MKSREYTKINFREIVKARMIELGINTFQLAKQLDGKVPQATLYQWLNADHDLPAEKLAYVLEELGVKITFRKLKKEKK